MEIGARGRAGRVTAPRQSGIGRGMIERLAKRPLLVALLIGIAAELLFAWQLGRPHKIVFDEVHYVGAARVLIDFQYRSNTEHPLLAKELIAASMRLFGDNPIGWRAFSTLAGTATVLGVYWILFLGWRRVGMAALGAFLVAVNQMVYVQARIAMLDGFLAAFLVLGIATLIWAMERPPERRWRRLMLSGVLFGLSVACKWAAAPYVAIACLIVLFYGGGRPVLRSRTTWFQALGFGGIALFAYFITFWPDFFLKMDRMPVLDIFQFQWAMYQQQTQILPHHPYQSSWWTWPLMIRPIWYFYEPDQGVQRGILLIGNPAVMWGGLAAVAACLWAGMRGGDRRMLAAGLLWVFSILVWAITPKSLGFYYYYYLSGIWLCIAIPPAVDRFLSRKWALAPEAVAGVALLYFVYFFPILSAAPLANDQAFNAWMWFDSWR